MADNKIIVPEKKIITNATLADRAVAFISALKHTRVNGMVRTLSCCRGRRKLCETFRDS